VLSQAILVTDSRPLAREVQSEVAVQRLSLTRRRILKRSLVSCRAIVVSDLDAAIKVANEYAPEHLILEVRDPRRCLSHVQNAGAVFLGHFSPEPLGDYCTGANHVLPTYGHARAVSGLSVRDFMKTISVQELTAEGLRSLGPTAITLAELEGLDAHARAVDRRLKALGLEACTTAAASTV
jgi:histidinol dehydrogenase